jgi:hypothetical protein
MLAPRDLLVCARPAQLLAGLVLSGLLGCAHQPATNVPAAAPPAAPAASPSPGPKDAAAAATPGAESAPAPAPGPPAARTTIGTAAHAPAPKRPAPAGTAPAAGTSPAPAAAAAAATPNPAALDLASLEQRLRDTHAIGVFTKLSLKNQVDDLLAQFRAFYAGEQDLTLAGLRRTYELLLMKVVTLLQDDDPGLAGAVSSSREAIWAILSDRNRFSKL